MHDLLFSNLSFKALFVFPRLHCCPLLSYNRWTPGGWPGVTVSAGRSLDQKRDFCDGLKSVCEEGLTPSDSLFGFLLELVVFYGLLLPEGIGLPSIAIKIHVAVTFGSWRT